MKVLFTVHQFFPDARAGVEIVTLGLACELKARGHEPRVLAAKRSLPGGIKPGEIEDYEFEGIPVRRIGRPEEGLSRPYRLNYENEAMAEKTREFLVEARPDIVHAMHLQGLSASVLAVFEEEGLPIVFTAADFWTVCPVVDLRRHDGAMCEGPDLPHCLKCIADRNPNPRIKTTAGAMPTPLLKAAGRMSRTPLRKLLPPLRRVKDVDERPARIRGEMERVDRVVAYTDLAKGLLSSNGVGAGKTEVSIYGIDASRVGEARRMRRPSPKLRVAFFGTLAPHKGPDTLVRAFGMLGAEHDATLAVHGDAGRGDGFVGELKSLAAGDARISFPGPFSREEVASVFAETDVLVVPSRWYENAPGVILEAFAAGAVVVATDLGGMSELVRHEENGLLFALEDEEDLARQLRRLAGEPGLLDRLRSGAGPVKTIGEHTDELETMYRELIEEKRAG